jgi:Cu2+-containing amine oxidase
VLWKHVEYRNGHNEARRARRLVVSFVATVVNYEYLFYWYFNQDGSLEYEIKLSGMLSTNLLSAGERVLGKPKHGVIVAPSVNAQVHQHMFCARLDVEVDGLANTVEEVDLVTGCVGKAVGESDPYHNAFGPVKTRLVSEQHAMRVCDQSTARTWRVSNPTSINPITGESVGYKLVPFTKGPAQPVLLTGPECAVSTKVRIARFPNPKTVSSPSLTSTAVIKRRYHITYALFYLSAGDCLYINRPIQYTHTRRLKTDTFFSSSQGAFATKHLWVTPHADDERFPAGEFTPQGAPFQGLPAWTKDDRSLGGETGTGTCKGFPKSRHRPFDAGCMECSLTTTISAPECLVTVWSLYENRPLRDGRD